MIVLVNIVIFFNGLYYMGYILHAARVSPLLPPRALTCLSLRWLSGPFSSIRTTFDPSGQEPRSQVTQPVCLVSRLESWTFWRLSVLEPVRNVMVVTLFYKQKLWWKINIIQTNTRTLIKKKSIIWLRAIIYYWWNWMNIHQSFEKGSIFIPDQQNNFKPP